MTQFLGISAARWLQVVGILVLGALLAMIVHQLVGRWAPSRGSYPQQGIDVSHHQGLIEWSSVRAAGVDFAYIKATEGGDVRDARFAANWEGARQAGIRRGAYHFYTLCRLASDQAANFIANVPREPNALPPVIDLEFGGNCKARPDRTVLLGELATFITMVEAHSEAPVMLYLTSEFDEYYRVSDAISRPLWLRRTVFMPDYGARPWVMWQANPRRRVSGIEGPVDWNVVRSDAR